MQLRNLHAKIVLLPGHFASIGSQNLTAQGTRSREASVVICDRDKLERLEAEISDWKKQATPISKFMLEEMEKIVVPLRRKIRKLWEIARAHESVLFEQEAQRVEEARLAAEAEADRLREKRLKDARHRVCLRSFRRSVEAAHVALPVVYGTVRGDIFRPFRNGRFTEWIANGSETSLMRLHRYLCVLPENGKIGWVKLLKTRLSKITIGVTLNGDEDKVVCGGFAFTPTLAANWENPENGTNLKVTLTNNASKRSWTIQTWFSIRELRIVRYDASELGWLEERIVNWMEGNTKELRARLLRLLVGHFRYEKNLTGVPAGAFFSKKAYRVNVRTIAGNGAFMVAEPI